MKPAGLGESKVRTLMALSVNLSEFSKPQLRERERGRERELL